MSYPHSPAPQHVGTLLDAQASANGTPSGTDGLATGHRRVIAVELLAATDIVEAKLWLRSASGNWIADEVYGTMSLAAGTRVMRALEAPWADRVYVELTDIDPDSDANDGTLSAELVVVSY